MLLRRFSDFSKVFSEKLFFKINFKIQKFMAEYNVPLAIYDYVPVFLFLIAYGLLCRIMHKYQDPCMAPSLGIGIILCFIGGFFKATHKLIIASTNRDILWMDKGLFLWQMAGFTLISYTIICMYRKETSKTYPGSVNNNILKFYMIPAGIASMIGLLSLIVGLSGIEQWRFIPLIAVVLANIINCIILIRYSFKICRLRVVPALIMIYLLLVLSLGSLSNQERTLAIQWVQQSLNTVTWIIFSAAMYLMQRYFENKIIKDTKSKEVELNANDEDDARYQMKINVDTYQE